MGLASLPCNCEHCSITTIMDTMSKRHWMPDACQDFKAVQAPVYGNSPQAEVYRIFPTLEQRCPFHQHSATGLSNTEQFTSAEHNSFQHSLVQQRPAPLPAVLPIYTHLTELELPNLATRSCETTTGPQNSSGVSQNDATPSNFHIRIPLLQLFLRNSPQYLWTLQQRILKPKIKLPALRWYSFGASLIFHYKHHYAQILLMLSLNYNATVLIQVSSVFITQQELCI